MHAFGAAWHRCTVETGATVNGSVIGSRRARRRGRQHSTVRSSATDTSSHPAHRSPRPACPSPPDARPGHRRRRVHRVAPRGPPARRRAQRRRRRRPSHRQALQPRRGPANAGGHALKFHHLDIRAPELVALAERRKPEVVFHLAAQSSVSISVSDPLLDATVNAVGTLNVLEAARAAGSRKVVWPRAAARSTAPSPRDLPVKESQLAASAVALRRVEEGGPTTTWSRTASCIRSSSPSLALANVYGPRQDPHGEAGVVSIFAGATAGR